MTLFFLFKWGFLQIKTHVLNETVPDKNIAYCNINIRKIRS